MILKKIKSDFMPNKSLCFDCPVKNCKVKHHGYVEYCSKRGKYEHTRK